MFSLLINNVSVFLPEDFTFGLERESPLFNDRGDFSYPFSIPYEPNKELFYHGKELASFIPKNQVLSFELCWCGNAFLSGEISEWQINGENVELTLTGGKTLFYSKIKDKHLDEIDLGSEDSTGIHERAVLSLSKHATTSPYVFAPVYAAKWLNPDGNYASEYLNDYDPNKSGNNVLPIHNRAMHLYLLFVLKQLCKFTGYNIGRNDLLEYSDFKRLYIVSLNILYIDGTKIKYKDALPHILVTDFLDTLAKWIGIHIIPNDQEGVADIVLIKNIIKDTDVNKEHSEKMLISDNAMRYRHTEVGNIAYNLSGDDYKYAKVNLPGNITQINSISDLPNPSSTYINSIRHITSTDRVYKCITYEDGDQTKYKWELLGELRKLEKANETNHTSINIHPMLTLKDTIEVEAEVDDGDPNGNGDGDNTGNDGAKGTITVDVLCAVELPYTSEKGNQLIYVRNNWEDYNDFPLMMCFYKGMRTYSREVPDHPGEYASFSYPTSTYDRFLLNEQNVGNLSLKLTGDNGIYKTFLQDYYFWEENIKREVEIEVDLSPADILNLSMIQKIDFDGHTFLIDKIHFDCHLQRINSIRMELLLV